MRGVRVKHLCSGAETGPERRKRKKLFKKARAAMAGTSPDTGTRKKWMGNIAPHDFTGHVVLGHVTRGIGAYFGELTETGRNKALNLRFGTERRHGSPLSLRRWPRGCPGQGSASRLAKPELLSRIAGLQKFRDVNQTARFA